MKFAMSSSPHIRTPDNTRRIMLDVLIALVPALVAGTIFFGPRCLVLAAVSTAAAVLSEALWRILTRQYQTVGDLSAAVTGLLLALTLTDEPGDQADQHDRRDQHDARRHKRGETPPLSAAVVRAFLFFAGSGLRLHLRVETRKFFRRDL